MIHTHWLLWIGVSSYYWRHIYSTCPCIEVAICLPHTASVKSSVNTKSSAHHRHHTHHTAPSWMPMPPSSHIKHTHREHMRIMKRYTTYRHARECVRFIYSWYHICCWPINQHGAHTKQRLHVNQTYTQHKHTSRWQVHALRSSTSCRWIRQQSTLDYKGHLCSY